MTWVEPENDPSTADPPITDPDFGTLRYASVGDALDMMPYVEETDSFPLELRTQDGSPVSGVPEVLISDGDSRFSPAAPGVGSGVGDMFGPGSATDNAIARFDGVTGKLIQDSNVIISDIWDVSGINDLTVGGQITIGNGELIGNADEHERIVFRSVGGGSLGFYTNDVQNFIVRNDGDVDVLTGDMSISLGDIRLQTGVFWVTERAAAEANVAGDGQYWVKAAIPNQAWFTDDAGNDLRLGHPDPVIVESLLDYFNGIIIESFAATITSNGTTVTLSLEKAGGGDLTMNFSDGQTTLDCTPAKTLTLTPGTDTVPSGSFVYILQSGKVLVEGSDWPTAEHTKIAYILVQSAATLQTMGGAYINQNWNDHAMTTNPGGDTNQGHLTHMTQRMRREGAIWVSGCEGVATVDTAETPDAIWVSVAAGFISQMHHHTFAALDSDTAGADDPILVVNDNTTPYAEIDGLHDITADSAGVAFGTNKYFSVVLWGAANKDGELSPMFVNLPAGQYGSLADAQGDSSAFTNYSIPAEFNLESSTGFLIAEFIIKKGASNYTVEDTIDLRGKTPGTASGGGGGAGDVSAAAVITDHSLVRGDGGAKGVQDSGILIDDSDNMSAINDLEVGGNLTLSDDWVFTQRGSHLAIQRIDSANTALIEQYPQDGDGTDETLYIIYAKGVPGDITTARERLWMGWSSARGQFEITGDVAGTGSAKPLSLSYIGAGGADNLLIDTDGDVTIASDLDVGGDLHADGNLSINTTSTSFVSQINLNPANATFTNAGSDFVMMWQNEGINALGVAIADDDVARLVLNNAHTLAINFGTTQGVLFENGATSFRGELEGVPMLLECGQANSFTLDEAGTDEKYLGMAIGVEMSVLKGFVMEKAGSFVGYTIQYDVTAKTGTSPRLTINIEKNGTSIYTDILDSNVLVASNNTSYASQARNTSGDTFAVGDIIGVKLFIDSGGGSGTITMDDVIATIRIYYDE